MARWGMVIDLTRCIGCYACMMSCKQEHFLPPGIFWGRLIIGEVGQYPTVRKYNLPVLCNHCKEAACVAVCPTGATVKREDGIVTVDYDKCIGCRYCVVACPYQQRTYLAKITEYYPGQGLTPYEEAGSDRYQTGVTVKCNLCVERIDGGLKKGLKPGVDEAATPACVMVCPAKARYFGDLDDPRSEVSRLIKERNGRPLHPEFGTEPSVFYLDY